MLRLSIWDTCVFGAGLHGLQSKQDLLLVVLVFRQQQEGQRPEGGRDCVCLHQKAMNLEWTGFVHGGVLSDVAGNCMVLHHMGLKLQWTGLVYGGGLSDVAGNCMVLHQKRLSLGWTGLVHAATVCGFAGDCMVC